MFSLRGVSRQGAWWELCAVRERRVRLVRARGRGYLFHQPGLALLQHGPHGFLQEPHGPWVQHPPPKRVSDQVAAKKRRRDGVNSCPMHCSSPHPEVHKLMITNDITNYTSHYAKIYHDEPILYGYLHRQLSWLNYLFQFNTFTLWRY